MSKQHTIDEVVFGNNFYEFSYEVFGFWSSPITLSVSRRWDSATAKRVWTINLMTASGGRDITAVPNDLDAMYNHSMVMQEAIEFGRELEANFPKFNEAYNKTLARFLMKLIIRL